MDKLYTVIIADDHQFLIQGILSVLKEMAELEVIETVNNGIELMTAVEKKPPDLVLLDLNMPGPDGLSVLKNLKTFFASIKVVILTNYNQAELIDQVKKLGADGFLVKNSSAAELKDALRLVLSGVKAFSSEKSNYQVSQQSVFFDDFLKKHNLTKREVGVIKMICQEMSSKEIAATLYLSELTIKTHRRNIMRKLDIKSIAGLINFAKENHII